MHSPKLSIGMPVYNGENFLTEAIESLLSQDYTDFQLFISDNASTDRTEEICRGFAAKDPRIRYERNPVNLGAGPNFRRVFELSESEYFKWAAHDDLHLPGFLRRCMETIETAPASVVLVCPRIFLVDAKGEPLVEGTRWVVERLKTHASTPHKRLAEVLPKFKWSCAQFGVLRRSAVKQTRNLESYFSSDQVFLAELALLGEIWEIDEPLFARRYHADISTNKHMTYEEYALWMDTQAKGPQVNWRKRMSVEYTRSIMRLPMPPAERALCLSVVAWIWIKQKARRAIGLSKNESFFGGIL